MSDTASAGTAEKSPFDLVDEPSAQPSNNHKSLEERSVFQVAAADLSADDASRFLAQAGFGGTDEEIAKVQRLGYEQWIDAELTRSPRGNRYSWLRNRGYLNEGDRFTGPGTFDRSNWRRMIVEDDVLRQRMT